MFNFIVGVIGILIVILGTGLVIKTNEYRDDGKKTKVYIPAIVGIAIVLVANSFIIIPTGYTGVKSIFGQINSNPISNGFNLKVPFIEHIELVNNKQQDIKFKDKIWGEAKEKTVVFAEDIIVTYRINPEKSAWIYTNVSNYKDNLVSSSLVSSAIKSAMIELETDFVTNRSYIEPLSQEKIQEAVNDKYGENVVEIIKVVINNTDFEDSYNEAIANKQIARQEKEKAEIENQTKVQNAEAEAEAQRIKAQGEADAKLIEAQAEAEANKLKEESLTDMVLRNKMIDKWNGQSPKVVGENGGLMYDISNLE